MARGRYIAAIAVHEDIFLKVLILAVTNSEAYIIEPALNAEKERNAFGEQQTRIGEQGIDPLPGFETVGARAQKEETK